MQYVIETLHRATNGPARTGGILFKMNTGEWELWEHLWPEQRRAMAIIRSWQCLWRIRWLQLEEILKVLLLLRLALIDDPGIVKLVT